MSEVEYKLSSRPCRWQGYQSKRGEKGVIKASIINIWIEAVSNSIRIKQDPFDLFVEFLITIFNHERFCLERAFQKIKIKGGMYNPCCVMNINMFTSQYLFNYGEGKVEYYESNTKRTRR